jgi:hypothetical protein
VIAGKAGPVKGFAPPGRRGAAPAP